MKTKWYVGYMQREMGFEAFRFDREPTIGTHGTIYAAVIGPFRTKRAALWTEKHGFLNPHVQTVDDAERLCRL